jgi:hypothetical protein
MKTLSLIILLAAFAGLSGPVAAEEYTIGFFTDEFASSCEITNVTAEVIRIHMLVYGDAETANTTVFYAPTPACWNATWLGDEINDEYLFLGSTHHSEWGVAITFTGCRTLPVRLGSMSFWAEGSTQCCTYKAYPAPIGASGVIEVLRCEFPHEIVAAGHESVIINPNESCTCTPSTVVATEETTWGQVKALYR